MPKSDSEPPDALRTSVDSLIEQLEQLQRTFSSDEGQANWLKGVLGERYETATQDLTIALKLLSPSDIRQCMAAIGVLKRAHHRPISAIDPLLSLIQAAILEIRIQATYELADYAIRYPKRSDIAPRLARLVLAEEQPADLRTAAYIASVRIWRGDPGWILDLPHQTELSGPLDWDVVTEQIDWQRIREVAGNP